MKKKIIIIICTALALYLCVSLVIGSIFSIKITAADTADIPTWQSADDSGWESVASGGVTLENENVSLLLDSETAHFTVTDKSSGRVYNSAAQAADGFEPDDNQLSEVVITYYDGNSAKASMNTCANSLSGKFFEIKKNASAIRVYYSIRKSQKIIFVPEVVSQKTFENDILSKLGSGQKRRLKLFYNLYESSASDSGTKSMKEAYPALRTENLYILSETAVESTHSEITGYMETAGFTRDVYSAEAERLGLDESVTGNQPAAFVVPVEYTLTDDGFSAAVLTDKITSESSAYKLTGISLLPYFSSCGYSENGWFLVPDGSGAVIELKEKGGAAYQQSLWGGDIAIESAAKPNLMQNAGLPVFGANTGSSAFFAEITGAGAVASVNAEVYGNEFLQSRIYASFNILSYDTSNLGTLRNQSLFNLYSRNYTAEFPKVTYTLFPDADSTYSDMANRYRDSLVKRGTLGERLDSSGSIPLYIDFTCYETIEKSIMGISTLSKTVLSDARGISTALSELESRGITGANVRLRAYSNGGIYGTVSNGFRIDGCVASTAWLNDTAKRLLNQNGKLYLENNISTVYYEGNSFDKMTHASRTLQKTIAKGIDFDLVARINAETVTEYYLTSPVYYDSLIQNFINTLQKKEPDASVYGYSWSDYGTKLWSDFNTKHTVDRAQSAAIAAAAVKTARQTFGKIITDGSNAYALPDASAMLNFPLHCSDLSCESYSVPFYQMVIHGYIDYSGAPVNAGTDSGRTYLATVESGANLYYSCYTSTDEPLKKTQAGTLIYPTLIASQYEDIAKKYTAVNEIFSGLRGQTITGHRRVAGDLFVTTYEDGTEIAVNYGICDAETESGVTVAAKSFTAINTGRGGQ